MRVPDPEPGLVVRYEYLWRRRAERGAVTADKDRPVCVVVARRTGPDGWLVVLTPVTGSPPAVGAMAVEIPPMVARHLSLGPERSWIIASEVNIDLWPSLDLRPASRKRNTCAYGFLPPRLFQSVLDRFAEARRSGIAAVVDRSES